MFHAQQNNLGLLCFSFYSLFQMNAWSYVSEFNIYRHANWMQHLFNIYLFIEE